MLLKKLFAIFYINDRYSIPRPGIHTAGIGHTHYNLQASWTGNQHQEDPGDGVHAKEDTNTANDRFLSPDAG